MKYVWRGVLLLIAVASFFGSHYYHSFHQQTLNIAAPTTIAIEPGTHFAFLVQQLHSQDIIVHPSYWLLHARVRGWDQKLVAGEHRIPAMSIRPAALLRKIISGDFLPSHRFTLLEGWNFEQTLKAMQEHAYIDMPSTMVNSLLRQHEQDHRQEGRLFPDTYMFKGIIAGDVLLQQARAIMAQKLAALWQSRTDGLPYRSADEALIVASIIEKEARLDEERAKIAGVFVERLRRGMRLQADPTVIYGIKEFNGDITRKDLRTDTAYNTYTRKGLPPTPIAMPGEASLKAAMHPSTQTFLYFVSKKDGSHHFSKTYKEHKSAVDRYQLGRR